MNASNKPRRSRVRPALRRFAIAALVVLIPLAAHTLWDHVEIRRLVREIEAIRAKGEPITEYEAGRAYTGSTDEHEQASRLYLAAAMLLLHYRSSPHMAELREWVVGAVPLKALPPQTGARLQERMDARSDALVLADRANALEFRGFEPGTEFNYRTSGLAALGQLLSQRTAALSLAGNGDGAVDAALASLRARRIPHDWLMLAVAADHEIPLLLSLSTPAEPALKRLQSALEENEQAYDPVADLQADRARMIELLWRRHYGPDPRAPRRFSLPARSISEVIGRPWLTHHLVRALRTWAELMQAAREPWPAKAASSAAVMARYRPQPGSPDGGGRRVPVELQFLPFRPVDGERLIASRCARAAVAVERFRRARSGALPSTLADLVPAYLADVPQDPLSGGPLLYRASSDSYTIYSVGADGRDDAGDLASQFHQAIEQGWGRRTLRGRDIGVRVVLR